MNSADDRLSFETLGRLPEDVARPGYDPRQVATGIVHLGVGAFHRAHQAVYLDDLLATDPQWGIVGASLRRPDMRDAMAPQDGLYAVAVRSGEGTKLRIVASIRDILVAPEDPEALLSAMCDPNVKIVSLTVTEKGYCHDPATGDLNAEHPDVKADLANPRAPTSAPGLLVEALRRRRDAGIVPFTVMPCDNLPANGPTVHRIMSQYAALIDGELARFVERDVAVAGTMVDRIVPATTDADTDEICATLGVKDAWPVVTEPFTQWVIEDRFPTGRPDFASVGAEMVPDVEPYERMKLRMLNGSHSTLAYLGYLAGYETVSKTMADPAFERLVGELMSEEVIPTLDVAGADLPAYRDALIARFHNPALKHRTWQIAMDGSQKLPQRLLGTIRDRLEAGQPIDRLALGVAAWMRYVTGVDEKGATIDVKDPLAVRLKAIADEAGHQPDDVAAGYLAVSEVFGRDLRDNSAFTVPVTNALTALYARGSAATVTALVSK
ncbi:mannitol dehydrogenase family protein [Jiella marina]|uniref:mannitol dehydrogenase family protein n=1 Tax=Jiella sp. LLJ827 TaxID=2917712 RepID=UPI002101BC45|nr:mannitol dehydrogenase family protein [Jiella sp. LLJ827]MCQ0986925.1 mannitol dehydrogenase family protein [Jiella sp. LLJ827]